MKTSMITVIIISVFVILLEGASGSPYVISDDRVRSLDVTPVLGRGYSIGTNSFQSTCLMVDETTVPSYNYDYYFTELTSGTDSETALAGKISASFGYSAVKAEVSASYSQDSKSESKSHTIVATMRLERYYSSLKEEVSPMSDDAKEILNRQDYIGFFKACGPNYVRSIRRAQEITAIFNFQSNEETTATAFAAKLKASGGWGPVKASVSADFSYESKYKSVASSLQIKIIGFGLGLKEDGSETLVATSLEEYNEVMKFAFKSMTQSQNSDHIGMVYGIEVVPWVDNSAFQVESKLLDEDIEIPLPRSLIPRATGDPAKCKNPGYQIDALDYCCSLENMYNYTTNEYNTDMTLNDADAKLLHCRLRRSLDKSVVKNNMALNGEFVARLDSIVRYRLNQLYTLEKCVSAVNAIPKRYDFNILKSQDTVKYDRAIETKFTVAELKMALDPRSDYSLVKHMGQELDEFMDMYYQPCIAAILGMNIGDNPDVEAKYFMAYPWQNHDECIHLSCLADNTRWDRDKGGCVPSLITGNNAKKYSLEPTVDPHESKCKLDENTDGSECKYTKSELEDRQDDFDECWNHNDDNGAPVAVVPTYLMEHFCIPRMNGEKVDQGTQTDIQRRIDTCKNMQDNPAAATTSAPTGVPPPSSRKLQDLPTNIHSAPSIPSKV